jgi:hypothetical protein
LFRWQKKKEEEERSKEGEKKQWISSFALGGVEQFYP